MWTCPDCGREFANRNQTHTCAPLRDLAWHLEGKPPEIAEIVGLVIACAQDCGEVVHGPRDLVVRRPRTKVALANLQTRAEVALRGAVQAQLSVSLPEG